MTEKSEAMSIIDGQLNSALFIATMIPKLHPSPKMLNSYTAQTVK
jgi:hypothetical protein